MLEYINHLEAILNRLESMEYEVQEVIKVAIVLASFGDKLKFSFRPALSELETLLND